MSFGKRETYCQTKSNAKYSFNGNGMRRSKHSCRGMFLNLSSMCTLATVACTVGVAFLRALEAPLREESHLRMISLQQTWKLARECEQRYCGQNEQQRGSDKTQPPSAHPARIRGAAQVKAERTKRSFSLKRFSTSASRRRESYAKWREINQTEACRRSCPLTPWRDKLL